MGAWRWDSTAGYWLHRPWWKVAINSVLRLVQPQARKWVIFTRCLNGRADNHDAPPIVIGYGFGRVLHAKTGRR